MSHYITRSDADFFFEMRKFAESDKSFVFLSTCYFNNSLRPEKCKSHRKNRYT